MTPLSYLWKEKPLAFIYFLHLMQENIVSVSIFLLLNSLISFGIYLQNTTLKKKIGVLLGNLFYPFKIKHNETPNRGCPALEKGQTLSCFTI
jgi:hypothetical protein